MTWEVGVVNKSDQSRVAEREGFEPSVEILSLRRFSKPLPSATRPPLQITIEGIAVYVRRNVSEESTAEQASYLSL